MKNNILTKEEVNHSSWQSLKAHIESRIDALRKENDANLDDVGTATIRGRIKELKKLLNDVEPKEIVTKKRKPVHE